MRGTTRTATVAARLRILHAPREGQRQLALGDCAELAQPGLRGERPRRILEPRRLQVDERQHRPRSGRRRRAGIGASAAIAGGQQQFNYDGLTTDEQPQAFYGMEFPNYWNLRTFWIYHADARRRPPHARRPGGEAHRLRLRALPGLDRCAQRAVFDMTVEVAHGVDSPHAHAHAAAGRRVQAGGERVRAALADVQRDEDAAQYVTTVPDPTRRAFFGNRYVFALHQDAHDLARHARQLDVHAESHAAAVRAAVLRERRVLAVPRVRGAADREEAGVRPGHRDDRADAATATRSAYTVDPDARAAPPFTFGDPDFTYRSLRGNAVLRWEYRPGSTVFFVWTQKRTGTDTNGNFDFRSGRRSSATGRRTSSR